MLKQCGIYLSKGLFLFFNYVTLYNYRPNLRTWSQVKKNRPSTTFGAIIICSGPKLYNGDNTFWFLHPSAAPRAVTKPLVLSPYKSIHTATFRAIKSFTLIIAWMCLFICYIHKHTYCGPYMLYYKQWTTIFLFDEATTTCISNISMINLFYNSD